MANAPGGIVDAPEQQQRVDAALQAAQDDGGFLGQVGGFFNGVWEVGSETVSGVVDLAGGIAGTTYDTVGGAVVDGSLGLYETATGTQVEEPGWLPDFNRGVDRLKTAGQVAGTLAENPGLLVDAVVDPIAEDWQAGNHGEAIGRSFAEVIGIVAGTKGVDKAAAGARVADALGDAGRIADDLGDVARLTDDVADVGTDVGRVIDDLPLSQRLPEFADGARHVDDVTGRTVVDASRGTTGDWSTTLDRAIEPDVIYRTDNGYLYHTDDQSRVTQVEGDLALDYDQARWPHRQDTVVRDNGVKGAGVVDPDQGGHLIARMFGGPGESINLTPMRGSINQGDWGDMERMVEELLADGHRVQIDIRAQYPEESLTRRPDRLDVELTITDPDGSVSYWNNAFDNQRP